MPCAHCGSELPTAFPGATVTCVCGAETTLDAPPARASDPGRTSAGASPSSRSPVGRGPYRGPSSVHLERESVDLVCPYCGNGCPPLARVCPHCDVRLDNIRCGGCYSLQEPGSFTCGRCGKALDLDPLLDATSAPCPRCNTPLEAPGGRVEGALGEAVVDARLHECPRCGGMFVPREVLADILCRAELSGSFPSPTRPALRALDEVRYVPCPLCHASMNRVNFGRVSGVIVDVCRAHGTWFDGGELTRVVAFAAGGGLTRTRAREADEEKAREKERRERGAGPVVFHVQTTPFLDEPDFDERIEDWRELLRDLFWP